MFDSTLISKKKATISTKMNVWKGQQAPPSKCTRVCKSPKWGQWVKEDLRLSEDRMSKLPSVKKTLTDVSKDPVNSGRLKPKSRGPRSPRSSLWKTKDLGNSRKTSSKLRTPDTQKLLSEMKEFLSQVHTPNATGRLVSKASAPIKEFFKVRAEWSPKIRQNRA